MAFSTGSSSGISTEINVTPLIDVLLVLLIIFMVLVPLKPKGLNSSIPQGKSNDRGLPPVTVSVLAGKTPSQTSYRIDDHDVPYAQLEPTLAGMFAIRQDHTLFVKADRSLSYQLVAEVVGKGKHAGAGQVALSDVKAPTGR
jgi:biopolymer transport protein TolR